MTDDDFYEVLSAYLKPTAETAAVLNISAEVASAYGSRAAWDGLPRDANPFDPHKEREQLEAWLNGFDSAAR